MTQGGIFGSEPLDFAPSGRTMLGFGEHSKNSGIRGGQALHSAVNHPCEGNASGGIGYDGILNRFLSDLGHLLCGIAKKGGACHGGKAIQDARTGQGSRRTRYRAGCASVAGRLMDHPRWPGANWLRLAKNVFVSAGAVMRQMGWLS